MKKTITFSLLALLLAISLVFTACPSPSGGGGGSGGDNGGDDGPGDTPSGYTLAVARITGQDSDYGSVEITTGAATGNASGATVKVTAAPESNYTFVKWVASDSINGTQESAVAAYEFTISANTTLYAVFDGDGTNTPKNIASKADLTAIGTNATTLGYKYKLFANITEDVTAPMGTFTGTLDGNGHSITLAIGSVGSPYNALYAGLFTQLGAGATVKNLALTGVVNASYQSIGNTFAGAVAGNASGGTIRVENIKSSVAVTGANGFGFGGCAYIGGIVGYVNHTNVTITNCYSSGAVVANASPSPYAGGIAGKVNAGTVEYCYASGAIEAINGNTARAGGTLSGLYGKNPMTVNGSPVSSGNDNDKNGENFSDWATAWPAGNPPWSATNGWKTGTYTATSTPKLWWE